MNAEITISDCRWNCAEGVRQNFRGRKEVGARKEDIPMLADKAMNDPCKPGNPREVTKEDFMELYEKAW